MGLGSLALTAGAVMLGYVGWEVYGTDLVAAPQQSAEVQRLEQEFSKPAPNPPKLGDAYALVSSEKLGGPKPVYEGTDTATLRKGVGHYKGSAQPGEVGNFAVAGHRTTYGKPFNRVGELSEGDLITVRTKDATFTYRVIDTAIVDPSDIGVILPVPNKPGAEPTRKLMTLTSCHPEFSSRERIVVTAELED